MYGMELWYETSVIFPLGESPNSLCKLILDRSMYILLHFLKEAWILSKIAFYNSHSKLFGSDTGLQVVYYELWLISNTKMKFVFLDGS